MQRTHLSKLGAPDFSLCGFHRSKNAASAVEQMFARLGQKYMPLISVKKAGADLLFESLDLKAEGRLRDVKTLGGARKAQFLRYCDEIT
jgi:hypothetical protein